MRATIGVVSTAFLALLVLGCPAYDTYHRAKQIRTFTTLQEIAGAIEQRRNSDTPLDPQREVEAYGGVDAWGNDIISVTKDGRGHRVSYVLISPGRDGVLDLDSLEDYFEVQPGSVAGDWDGDVVFRNGDPVWNAGK